MSTNPNRNTQKRENEEDKNNSSSLVPWKHQKCSTAVKTIADLQYDVLEMILELVVGTKKTAGFLNASLVCKKWNEIIAESPRIMHVLSPTVKLRQSEGGENVEEFKITRKYREFALRPSWRTHSDPRKRIYQTIPVVTMSTISTCLTSLRSLKLKNLKLELSHFSAMSSLSLLKRLSIEFCTAKPFKMEPISFELDYLKMCRSSECILDWMNCKKLKTFDYDSMARENASTVNFLNRLEELNELIFFSYDWRSDVPELKPQFKWKKLKLQIAEDTRRASSVAKSNILALGGASAADGEAHININSDWLYDSPFVFSSSDFTIDFLNNCKKIKTLELFIGDCGENSIRADLSALRVMHEVETLYDLECDFKDAEGLNGLKSLFDKLPNLKNVTLALRNEGVNNDDPINIQLKNLETLTIRPAMRYDESPNAIGFDSTAMFWRIFTFGSSLKQLKILLEESYHDISTWHSNNGEVNEENSPIRLYKDWVSAVNRSSVESCTMQLTRSKSDPSRGMMKTRDDVELEVFGRQLNADEKKFFTEIIIEDE